MRSLMYTIETNPSLPLKFSLRRTLNLLLRNQDIFIICYKKWGDRDWLIVFNGFSEEGAEQQNLVAMADDVTDEEIEALQV